MMETISEKTEDISKPFNSSEEVVLPTDFVKVRSITTNITINIELFTRRSIIQDFMNLKEKGQSCMVHLVEFCWYVMHLQTNTLL